ncbi:hypothetical protein FGO68_gene15693 [Halteria grandinella]|uniref:Phosphatidylinositol-3,4,5-trisphosphate 3-phosphatase n=1 Tax=Halteria grandinella TaxID=5974 RepID=A0A8J8T6C1_HALGN|nr:hypothetical protein FGO68_gene15693 [Halteria grandinella]
MELQQNPYGGKGGRQAIARGKSSMRQRGGSKKESEGDKNFIVSNDYDWEIRALLNAYGQINEQKVPKDNNRQREEFIDELLHQDDGVRQFLDCNNKVLSINTKIWWMGGQALKDEDDGYKKRWRIAAFLCSCDAVRQCVSLKKKRVWEEGFDLDMTYITPNIIAMGYPADGFEGKYRNHKDQVSRYLRVKHYPNFGAGDSSSDLSPALVQKMRQYNKIKIYNLCIEKNKQYGPQDMPGFKISSFAFPDHNVCGMKTILNFCIDAHLFLSEHDKRGTLFSDSSPDSKTAAIAVHCKAGKGRTGLMIISFLIFSDHIFEKHDYPFNAINYYNIKRTMNGKGLTIPSQIRYVHCFHKFLEREIQRPFFSNTLSNYNIIQAKFNSMQESQSKLMPFSITMGPFPRIFDLSSFDVDIYQLESIDKNQVQLTYRLSDFRNQANVEEMFKWKQAKYQEIFEGGDFEGGEGGLGDLAQHPKHKSKKGKQSDPSAPQYYCTFFFNFDRIHNGDPIKLGNDFRFVVEVGGKKFHFWLNTESLKHRDLKDTYEDDKYDLPDHCTDEQLMQLLAPRGIELITASEYNKNNPPQLVKMSALRQSQSEEEKVKGSLERIRLIKDQLLIMTDDVKQLMEDDAQDNEDMNNVASPQMINGNNSNQFGSNARKNLLSDAQRPSSFPNNDLDAALRTKSQTFVQQPQQVSDISKQFELAEEDDGDIDSQNDEEQSTLWDNFNAQAFQECDRLLKELDSKLNPKNVHRKFYKASLDYDGLDKVKPKETKVLNVSLVLYDETN